MNLRGDLAVTSSVPADVGTWTWQGYGWAGAAANVRTNFDYYADVDGIGALAVTSPDPNWAVAQTPTNLVAASAYLIRFTSPTNEYRLGGWKYQFEAEVAGTLTMENLDPVDAEIANWEVEFGSHSETGFISIAASSSETVTWGTLTNIHEGVAHDTNRLVSCGSLSVTVTDGGTVPGNSIFYETSTITHTANSFLLPWVWAKRYSASVVPSMAFSDANQKDFTNLLADVTTQREMYLESDTPPIISIVNPDDIPFELSTNFVFSPEVADLRYDETNMVGQFSLMGTWTESTPIPTNIYADGEIGETIPYGSGVEWDQGWHIKFESPDVIKGLYLMKWDVPDGFRFGKVTNIYEWPLQESE
tara:strand:+ start:38 stop:1120 length:1083 start_codon:yes stop_codon:yes gene_type:complete